MPVIPPYLSQGDTIGILCPSGFMPFANAQKCMETLQQWGFQVKVGRSFDTQFNYFSGTDKQRLEDMQQMLNDDSVKAILCARGGYGLSRIIDDLSFRKFIKNPKWIVGYSDITVLHSHLYRRYKMASLHSPMAAAFNDGQHDNRYVHSLRDAITGCHIKYLCAPHDFNKTGRVRGTLFGGNLTLLAHLVCTPSDVDTAGKILFIEDLGEYIYNIDRMLHQLKRSAKLQKLAGLIVGSFTEMKDTTIPFGKNVYEVISEAVKEYDYPVCFGFPVGHVNENYALKIGMKHTLTVGRESVTLEEKMRRQS